jgi:putative transposase
VYVSKKGRRFTLALRACRRSEGLLGALQWLLQRFFALGGPGRCLYLDRGFYSVQVLRYLIEDADLPFCMAAPQQGDKDGLAALVRREGGGSILTPSAAPSPGAWRFRGRWGGSI